VAGVKFLLKTISYYEYNIKKLLLYLPNFKSNLQYVLLLHVPLGLIEDATSVSTGSTSEAGFDFPAQLFILENSRPRL
jgi:hypothetical protein